MEFWDIYDHNRVFTGKTKARGADLALGQYHLVVHVCVFNQRGELLIQQRQPFKKGWSNMWDFTVGGSALAGESSRQAAERELFEEIGLRHDFKDLRPFLSINFDEGYDDFYVLEKEVDLDSLSLQYEEVQNVRWATKDMVMALYDEKLFIDYHRSFIEFMFERGNRRSIFKSI